MRNKIKLFISLTLLVFLINLCLPEVNVNVNINVGPPPVKVKPTLVVIPETKVMYVSNFDDVEIFYFDGYYFCYYGGYWWRTKSFSNSWIKIETKYVPVSILKLPINWREKIKIKYKHTHINKSHNNKEIIIITPKRGKGKIK